MPEMNLRPVDVVGDEIVYTENHFEDCGPYRVIRLEGQARGGRYDLYVIHDMIDDSLVFTLANFGKAMKLKLSYYRLPWDYVADKLELRKVDAQVATHMINKSFSMLGLVV